MTNAAKLIEQFTAAIEAYGYTVIAEPIAGEEEKFIEHLRLAYAHLIATQVVIEAKYKTRGMSKRALAILHTMIPEPLWGVVLK